MRDLIYFDVEKAASMLSQLEGGLLKEVRDAEDLSTDVRGSVKASLQVIQAELGSGSGERLSRVETRVIHHDLLSRIETVLFDEGYAVDLNSTLADTEPTADAIRAVATTAGYIRAEGWGVFEDYERMAGMLDNFNGLVEVMKQSARHNLEESDEFKSLRAMLDEQKQLVESERDRNKQHKLRAESRKQEKELDVLLDSLTATQAGTLPGWLVDGIRLWISVFSRGQIHLRLYPFEEVPGFQVLAKLKREAFTDDNIEHPLFAYGNRPNVKLTVLGLLTSAPPENGIVFNPMQEFLQDPDSGEQDKTRSMEKAFRTAFDGIEGLEALMRFQRWPNVVVYPIAVFRQLRKPA